jgi:predicted transcriptional regulator
MEDVEKISELRKKLGLTQSGLAKLAMVSQSLIAKIEAGNVDPAYSKIKAIFHALDNEMTKKERKKKAIEIAVKSVIFVKESDSLEKVMKIIKEKAISQIPVLRGRDVVGSISDEILIDIAENKEKMIVKRVRDVMQESFPIIPDTSDVDVATSLLHYYKAVLIKKDGNITGIVTKADLIKAIK